MMLRDSLSRMGWLNDLPDGVSARDVFRVLREAGCFPSLYRAEVTIDQSAVGMDHHVRALEEAGCSPAEVLDYYYVEIQGWTQQRRADSRGVGQPSVSENVGGAKNHLRA